MKKIRLLILKELLAGLLTTKEMIEHDHPRYVFGSDDCIIFISSKIREYEEA